MGKKYTFVSYLRPTKRFVITVDDFAQIQPLNMSVNETKVNTVNITSPVLSAGYGSLLTTGSTKVNTVNINLGWQGMRFMDKFVVLDYYDTPVLLNAMSGSSIDAVEYRP